MDFVSNIGKGDKSKPTSDQPGYIEQAKGLLNKPSDGGAATAEGGYVEKGKEFFNKPSEGGAAESTGGAAENITKAGEYLSKSAEGAGAGASEYIKKAGEYLNQPYGGDGGEKTAGGFVKKD
ncbi:hypothetical protein ACP275_12G097100 [Erythranthe tilingii]